MDWNGGCAKIRHGLRTERCCFFCRWTESNPLPLACISSNFIQFLLDSSFVRWRDLNCLGNEVWHWFCLKWLVFLLNVLLSLKKKSRSSSWDFIPSNRAIACGLSGDLCNLWSIGSASTYCLKMKGLGCCALYLSRWWQARRLCGMTVAVKVWHWPCFETTLFFGMNVLAAVMTVGSSFVCSQIESHRCG